MSFWHAVLYVGLPAAVIGAAVFWLGMVAEHGRLRRQGQLPLEDEPDDPLDIR
jgi:hypothetical protein